LYIGYSRDIRKRITKHKTGQVPATKYRTPLELVYFEAYKSPRDAHKREAMLKLYSKTWTQLKRRIKNSLE
jgi:predicted GIY-YIG superfamily endonuclease